MDEEAKMRAIEAARALVPAAKEHFPRSAVYLFGSHAKGCADEHSDIDVAVIVPDYDGMGPDDLRLACRDLWEKAGGIDARMEPCVRTMRDRSGFVRAVLETGIRVD